MAYEDNTVAELKDLLKELSSIATALAPGKLKRLWGSSFKIKL